MIGDVSRSGLSEIKRGSGPGGVLDVLPKAGNLGPYSNDDPKRKQPQTEHY